MRPTLLDDLTQLCQQAGAAADQLCSQEAHDDPLTAVLRQSIALRDQGFDALSLQLLDQAQSAGISSGWMDDNRARSLIRLGRIEPGAAMGVVFTAMFAGGVLLLEQSDTSSVHLDVEHALYGNLESLIWLDAVGWSSLWDIEALRGLPPELPRMALTLAFVSVLTWVCWRPLKLSTFDEGFARTMGLPVGAIGLALVVVAAIAAVAAFDAVGSIIVIAMFICPPAAARMMTNGLEAQVAWSILFAVISAVLGYVLAGYGPLWLGFDDAVSAAGMIATVSGVILALAAMFGPCRHRSEKPRQCRKEPAGTVSNGDRPGDGSRVRLHRPAAETIRLCARE